MLEPARTCCSVAEGAVAEVADDGDEVAVGEDEVELAVVAHVGGGDLIEVARWGDDGGVGGVGAVGAAVPDVDLVGGGGVGVGVVGGGVIEGGDDVGVAVVVEVGGDD